MLEVDQSICYQSGTFKALQCSQHRTKIKNLSLIWTWTNREWEKKNKIDEKYEISSCTFQETKMSKRERNACKEKKKADGQNYGT